MKKAFGILVLIASVLLQGCQKPEFLAVTGIVTDSITNNPLEGAYVRVNGEIVYTAKDGTFAINNVKPGKNDFMVFSYRGYKMYSRQVFVSNDKVTKIDFALTPINDPRIETGNVNILTTTSASATATITVPTGTNVYAYGHCWSYVSSFPTLAKADGFTSFWGGSDKISFTSTITGLTAGNIYYIRAYARTSKGDIYGKTVAFNCLNDEINRGLIGYYPFNDYSLMDESGQGNNLDGWNFDFSYDRFGSRNAINLDDSFLYGYSKSYREFHEFTFSFWFEKFFWAGTDRCIISVGFPYYSGEISIGEDANSKIYFLIKTQSGNTYQVSSNNSPSLNTWHHVVCVRNNGSIQLFIDGILQGIKNSDSQMIMNDSNESEYGYLFLGLNFASWTYFSGNLDDLRIYDRALNSEEINFLATH